MNTFHLMYEPSIYASFLASAFRRRFEGRREFIGTLILAVKPELRWVQAKAALHTELRGRRRLSIRDRDRLKSMYPDITETGLDMVRAYGVPAVADILIEPAIFMDGLETETARNALDSMQSLAPRHIVFTFVDRIFSGAWLDSPVKLLNAHPGVLPFARGVGALEQIAASGDREMFCKAAGASLHYVTASVDGGPVVRIERQLDPFAYQSLSELRARNFMLAFSLMADLAWSLCIRSSTIPEGVVPSDINQYPLCRRRDRTPEIRARAEKNYLAMKAGKM